MGQNIFYLLTYLLTYYQYIKDCEAGGGRTPSVRKLKSIVAFFKGMPDAFRRPILLKYWFRYKRAPMKLNLHFP